ncbi:MAG: hypothetical protein IH805_06655, partial [Proteobacteria bacterium]|nr:hypothetical protein [Pseudomonadota bacterium]
WDLERWALDLSVTVDRIVNSPATRYGSAIEMSRQAVFRDRGQRADPQNSGNTYLHYYYYGQAIGLALDLDFPDDLPLLRGDERKLKQILANLLTNAIKFTDAGGKVTLRAWCRADSGFVFQIIDTGIGIAAEDIPKALSRFGQVDGDLNRQYEGTGLGLPLTKALVELHGGSLTIDSVLGVGTTVTVVIPSERVLDRARSAA